MALNDVKLEKNHDANVNADRTAFTFFNKVEDLFGVAPKMVRAVRMHAEGVCIGNHWRDYAEVYSVIGQAHFNLEDIHTKEKRAYDLNTGERLFVPPRIGLNLSAEKDSLILIASEEIDRESHTHKYEIR